jgi:hypothetical protein
MYIDFIIIQITSAEETVFLNNVRSKQKTLPQRERCPEFDSPLDMILPTTKKHVPGTGSTYVMIPG